MKWRCGSCAPDNLATTPTEPLYSPAHRVARKTAKAFHPTLSNSSRFVQPSYHSRASAPSGSLGVKLHLLRSQKAVLPPSPSGNGTQNARPSFSELETPHKPHLVTYLPILLAPQTGHSCTRTILPLSRTAYRTQTIFSLLRRRLSRRLTVER